MPTNTELEQARNAARQRLEAQGVSVQAFSKQHALHPSTVYAVLSGQQKCRRGEAHRAAVLLGIKEGVCTVVPAAQGEN